LLTTSFALGTVERFLLPSYLFITIWIGEGIVSMSSLLKYKKNQQITTLVTNGILLVCTILPLSLLYINITKISSITNDYTAENYARDLLNTTGNNAILFVSRDTAVFNTQYVYFTENKWPKTILIHSFRLSNGEAIPALHIRYPNLTLKPFDPKKDYINQFIEDNYHKFPIFTSSIFYVDPALGGWVPEGLLYRFYSNKDLPKITDLVSRNKTLWSKYHDPLKNRERGEFALMPSNVLDFYKEGRMESGKLFEGAGDLKSALEFYQKAVKFDPEDVNTYYALSRVYGKLGRCDDGKKVLALSLTYKQTPQYFQFMGDLYKNCYKDEKKATQYFDAYKKKTSTDIKLKEL
jgi:tetratricopeptide (TPR) repeat protein